ncbi:MAG: class I SAM-dependent methyltransferase [Polyangiaceae bacterium]|nr:class I SAM-dependent methyltransferase [Polyangiaceae bacterium]
MQRVLEPEIMDSAEEARDYDAMDHVEVNARFCDDLVTFAKERARAPRVRVLDVGTGTARIPIELRGRVRGAKILGIDLGDHMLALGRENIEFAEFEDCIELARIDAKTLPFDEGAFDWTISNSIIHHIAAPAKVFAEMWRVTARGGVLFVRDLARPDSTSEIDRLVACYGGTAPEDAALVAAFEHQRNLLRDSLGAALTVFEVRVLVAPLGISERGVTMTSDRHWTLAAEKP